MTKPRLRIGALRYLNALPLVAGLAEHPLHPDVHYQIPSLLAQDLRAGEFDLALVPQVEASRHAEYRIVPKACVACQGPVESILLFSRKSWSEITRVGVDISSNSSVELLRVLFHVRGQAIPELVPLPPRLDPLRTQSPEFDAGLDAMLLIGDRALAEDHGEFPRFDLGALWYESVKLPFVFAVWMGRVDVPDAAIQLVGEVLDANLGRRDELAAAFVREHPDVIDEHGARRYLTETIRYRLGPAERESMLCFARLRAEIGSVTADWCPRFFGEV